MNLFRRGAKPPTPVVEEVVSAPPIPEYVPPPKSRRILLTAEQKSALEKPVDPRVDRILNRIYADKATAERALDSRNIIDFHGDSDERHVIKDGNGFWRIVSDAPSDAPEKLIDAL